MPTREQFQTIYDQGADAVFLVLSARQKQINLLQAEAAALRERLDKDSHNSHKPPSSDGYSQNPVSLRSQTARLGQT